MCVLAAGDVGLVRVAAAGRGAGLGSIAAGASHGCAVRGDGTLACWGDNFYGQITAPAGTFTHGRRRLRTTRCGLRTDGTLACWGINGIGQSTPPAGTLHRRSAAGRYHTCGTEDGRDARLLGQQRLRPEHAPRRDVHARSPGAARTPAGVKTDGTIACWGDSGRLHAAGTSPQSRGATLRSDDGTSPAG